MDHLHSRYRGAWAFLPLNTGWWLKILKFFTNCSASLFSYTECVNSRCHYISISQVFTNCNWWYELCFINYQPQKLTSLTWFEKAPHLISHGNFPSNNYQKSKFSILVFMHLNCLPNHVSHDDPEYWTPACGLWESKKY